ncbi:hypothetical protein [Leptospira noguchii]|uniref:hypothetical protein n=1 Tax=Leptospira noguchii TaxID=28182 RepID=UPI0012FBA6FC|nr:hypothetical protein [Leptospira noguchii]
METQHNAFLNSASHSPNSAKRFPECRSLERHSLSSLGRVNSAKRFPKGRVLG